MLLPVVRKMMLANPTTSSRSTAAATLPVHAVASMASMYSAAARINARLHERLREILTDARVYRTRRADFERAQTRPFAASRLDLEALIPVLDGKVPIIINADKASDIEAAIKLANEFKLKLIIGGGAEAWEVAPKLAAAKVPVLTGAMNNIPESFSSLGQRQENAGLLAKAGVAVALIGNERLDTMQAKDVREREAHRARPDDDDVHIMAGLCSCAPRVRGHQRPSRKSMCSWLNVFASSYCGQ